MTRFEFMSPGWIEMARGRITQALREQDLRGIDYTLCEEFTNPPQHLRRGTAGSVGFYVRVADGRVEVGDHPVDDADLKVVSEYTDALAAARDPDAAAADPGVVQERIADGRLRIEGDPAGMPPAFAKADIHKLLAPATA